MIKRQKKSLIEKKRKIYFHNFSKFKQLKNEIYWNDLYVIWINCKQIYINSNSLEFERYLEYICS